MGPKLMRNRVWGKIWQHRMHRHVFLDHSQSHIWNICFPIWIINVMCWCTRAVGSAVTFWIPQMFWSLSRRHILVRAILLLDVISSWWLLKWVHYILASVVWLVLVLQLLFEICPLTATLCPQWHDHHTYVVLENFVWHYGPISTCKMWNLRV